MLQAGFGSEEGLELGLLTGWGEGLLVGWIVGSAVGCGEGFAVGVEVSSMDDPAQPQVSPSSSCMTVHSAWPMKTDWSCSASSPHVPAPKIGAGSS